MAEISRQSDIAVARVALRLGLERDGTAIRAAVVDEDDLGWTVELLIEQDVEPPQQDRQHGLLVVDRDDDAVADRFVEGDVASGAHGLALPIPR